MGLRAAITIQQEVDQYKIEWNTAANREKVLILVEGKNDVLFYFKFFDHSKTEIRQANGCQHIDVLLQKIVDDTEITAIVIKDSDFARLNGTLSTNQCIFYADAHDYEMMCIKNEQVRHDLMENNGIAYSEVLYDKSFEDLKLLSYIQWYNYTNHLGYEASKVSVGDKNDTQLSDYQVLHDEMILKTLWSRQKTARKNGDDPNSVTVNPIPWSVIDQFMTDHSGTDKYELTRGHGFITRFIHNVKMQHPEFQQSSEDGLKKVLHPCFRAEHFKVTNLYAALQQWQIDHSMRILAV